MSITPAERQAISRALELAAQGPTGINPQVGAVLLDANGAVISEGFHHGAGTPHAEVEALKNAEAPHTAVVTLEPCNHIGRTGPCSHALVEAGVQRVVFATSDPGDESGGGAEFLRAHGVDVVELEPSDAQRQQAEALIANWLVTKRLGRPHITVKWAQSIDGRAAANDGTSQWITGEKARADVHLRRAQADTIIAGTGTVLADNPALTARDPQGALYGNQPRAVIVGSREIPGDAHVRSHPGGFAQLSGDLGDVLRELSESGAQRVFVEGGPTLASAFIREGLADELLIYIAPTLIGGDRLALGDLGIATINEQLRLTVEHTAMLGTDFFVHATPNWPARESN